MKKNILPLLIVCTMVIMQSCSKEQGTKYVNLNETVKSGESFSLDMNAYSSANARISISTQPTEFTVSQLDWNALTKGMIYHFTTDSKTKTQERTVINIAGNKNNRCSHDDNKTVVAINFRVE